MYMNVIRNVICTLIILPIGLQAETSHSSMAKDTITVVATGNQNTVFETPSMVSVVTNDTPWSQNAVTSAGMLNFDISNNYKQLHSFYCLGDYIYNN